MKKRSPSASPLKSPAAAAIMLRMKKQLVVGLLTLGLGIAAQATLITGNITISGGADLDSDDLGSATQVDTWSSTVVQSADGDFSGIAAGTSVTMTAPWTFNSGALPDLWSVGGFTFDLSSSAVTFQNGTFLKVHGIGTISAIGFDPTPGIFNFTTQEPDAGGVFSFSSANEFVPDGGSTLALFGSSLIALAGLACRRRKLA